MHNDGIVIHEADSMTKPSLFLIALCTLPHGFAHAQESNSIEDTLLGVWKMEPRILRRADYVAYQEDATIAITGRLPDGRYTVIARMTTRVVTEVAGTIDIPGCEDKKECIYDDATEGIGSSFRSAFYIDYFSSNWIDDLFTVKGNVMTADDGNGPIKLIKKQ